MATQISSGRNSPAGILHANPRASAVVSAVAATLAIWAIATFIGDVDLTVPQGEVGPIAVVLTTLIAGLAAWGLLAFLERRTDRAWPIWVAIAIVVFLISLAGPIGAETGNGRIVLSVMHAVTAAILFKGFSGTVRRD